MARAWLGSGKDRIDDQRVGGDVRATVENGTGLLLLIPHLGHWELLGHWVSQLGPLHALYQPPKAEGLDALVLNGRRGAGFQVHPTTVRGVSALSKALKNGEIVAVLPDQHPDPEGSVKAPFFNHAIPTMTLAAKLIQKNPQAHVLTLAALRRFPGAYEVVLDRPNEEFRNSDLVTACTEMNQSIERLIAQAPEQYQWEYKRFRGLPAGVQPY